MKYALRQLLKSPGFTAVAILSLALGIGANTAIFSLANEFLLRALPVRAPEELILFRTVEGPGGRLSRAGENNGSVDPVTGRFASTSFSLQMLERFRESPALSEVFAFSPISQPNLLIDGQPETVISAQLVSGNYHRGLGVSAFVGRTFSPDDDRVSAPPTAVISFRYWKNRFGGDPAVLGQTVVLNRVPVTIIGVTAPGFDGAMQAGESPDISVPLALHLRFQPDRVQRNEPWYWWIRIMARRAPGATPEQVRASLEPTFQSLAREGWLAGRAFDATPRTMPGLPTLMPDSGAQGENDARRTYAASIYLLLGLVGLVLVAACANVANLLLARGAGRRREIALRLALGASRARIVRQLLAEALLLAGCGAALGVLLAAWGRSLLLALHPFGDASVVLDLPLDLRVLAFTSIVAVLTALLFGLAPALRATRINLTAEFQGGASTLGGGARSRLSQALMVLQVALSLIMLVSTGLFVRTLRNLQDVNPGFNHHQLALFAIDGTVGGYTREQLTALYARLQERLTRIPGVRVATYSRNPLLSRTRQNNTILAPGQIPPADADKGVHTNNVAPNFFSALELPLLLGRGFYDHDELSAPKVGVINQALALRYFGHENPIGHQLILDLGFASKVSLEIVGVAADAKYTDLRTAVPPTLYVPSAQRPGGAAHFVVRAASEPAALFTAIRAAVREIDPALPVVNLRTQAEQIDRLNAQPLLLARLSGFFGVLVLALACVGLYGLMSFIVLRRTGEIGVRMALGALPRQILQMVLAESLSIVALGLLVGTAGAYAASHLVTALLFAVPPFDPAVYGLVALGLIGVASLAAWLPARRAARISPMQALRNQ